VTSELYNELSLLATEQRNPASMEVDLLGTYDILKLINHEDKTVALAVEKELAHIAQAVDVIVDGFQRGGRLVYVGAGTSGRLGVVDAAECPPTFGTDPGQVVAVIAGGKEAVFQSQEGAEDNAEQAKADIESLSLTPDDVMCAIAASRRTPYVLAAVEQAKARGTKTIFITTNPRSSIQQKVDVAICPEVGPEVVMGSTRMKSGTAQKLVLNMLTTASMIRLGKVYENMMVDLQLTNQKLVERAKRIIMIATGVTYKDAEVTLRQSGNHVKTAIVMITKNVPAEQAREYLRKADGFVRAAIEMR
jgi:N-acetylmuramic acid 6-phosphate etherase